MNHLDKDKILDIVSSDSIDKNIKKHLSDCDKCFNKYVSIKSSLIEIENAKIEEIPSKYISRLNNNFNIKTENEYVKNKNIFQKKGYKLLDNILNVFNDFVSPKSYGKSALAFGTSVTPAILILILYLLPMNPIVVDRMVFRSSLENNFVVDDLTNKSEKEIVHYAKMNNLNLKINIGTRSFKQSPDSGDIMNSSQDTLMVDLPVSFMRRIKYWSKSFTSDK